MTTLRSKTLEALAAEIDAVVDSGNSELLLALDGRCAELLAAAAGTEAATIWYFRSNVQAGLQTIDDSQSWRWRQPHRERQILYLRKSRTHRSFPELDPVVRLQVATNLANNLNALGRSIEALAMYDDALRHVPTFAMALGNRGLARMELARALHDRGHSVAILVAAHEDFSVATRSTALWDGPHPGVQEAFLQRAREIERVIDVKTARRSIKLDGHSLGRSLRERRYRAWCLEHQLFLNPLNVLGAHSIAATDRFGLPDHTADVDEPPQFIAWFNQLKQEYAAARLLLFEHQHEQGSHFADRELMLVDTLDNPAFGINIEKMRLAFRIAYGLLDKVAGFINAYFALGMDPKRVDLRNVWLTPRQRSIRAEFVDRQNLPLRGLYWLAFDIVGAQPDSADAISPDADDLSRLRNALEHRCLVLRQMIDPEPMGCVETTSVLAFRERAFTIVRLARAALMYLSLAVHSEEQSRKQKRTGLAVPRPLPTYRGRQRRKRGPIRGAPEPA